MSFAAVVPPPKEGEYQIVVVFTRNLEEDTKAALHVAPHVRDARDRLLRLFAEELGDRLYRDEDEVADSFRLAYMQMTIAQVRKAQAHIDGRNLWTND